MWTCYGGLLVKFSVNLSWKILDKNLGRCFQRILLKGGSGVLRMGYVQFTVGNRWGERLLKQSNIKKCWNTCSQSGNDLLEILTEVTAKACSCTMDYILNIIQEELSKLWLGRQDLTWIKLLGPSFLMLHLNIENYRSTYGLWKLGLLLHSTLQEYQAG